jgi:hypothetical protein
MGILWKFLMGETDFWEIKEEKIDFFWSLCNIDIRFVAEMLHIVNSSFADNISIF